MLQVTVGAQLKTKQGAITKTDPKAPFVATGTIETAKTKADATVLVKDNGDGTASLVVDERQPSTIGRHTVGHYSDRERRPVVYTAQIPPVPAPTEADAAATKPGELKEGVVLEFEKPVFVTAPAAQLEKQPTF